MSSLPIDDLERQAAADRRQLDNSVVELRQAVKDRVKDHLDIKAMLREHVRPAAGVLALLGLVLGFVIAGVFTRD
jgi:hypothetical protein